MNIGAFSGKRVFISGGSGGIGFAAARMFARGGARLAITGRSAERGEAAARQLRELGAQSVFLRGESGEEEACERMAKEAVRFMGGIDVAVSAGAESGTGLRPFERMTADYMRQTMGNLFYPRVLPVRAAVPHLKSAGGGAIVMICSDAARHPTPGEGIVGAAGAAVMVMTKVLARELARDGIRVNAVAMTITSGTPGWERAFASDMGKKIFAKALERFPQGRPPNADEVAQAITYLASDAAAQVSGQTLSVNGGLSFGGW